MSYGWALIQYDSCPPLQVWNTDTQREDHMKTQEKTAIYKPKTEASEETSTAHILMSNIQAPESRELNSTHSTVLYYSSHSKNTERRLQLKHYEMIIRKIFGAGQLQSMPVWSSRILDVKRNSQSSII